MNQPQRPQSEIDLVYNVSSKLIRASTPLEQLEAVSEHARSQGASRGAVFYIEYDEEGRTDVVAAEWITGDTIPYQVGTRFRLPHLSNNLIPPESSPILISDTRTDHRLSSTAREIHLNHHIYSCAILLLYNRGQRVAGILFGWQAPRQFDEQDERIYTVLQQLAAPVVDSVRLFDQTQKRASELESAKREMDILYDISRQLVRAITPAETLEAISAYARIRGAVHSRLGYFVDFQPKLIEVVAAWTLLETIMIPVGTRIDITNLQLTQHTISHPDHPTFVPDLLKVDVLAASTRQRATAFQVRGIVQLPMYVNGRWIGILTFEWDEPQSFSEQDERIFTALQQQAAPVIDSMRLLDQSRSRTDELEQANQEINLLYRTSEIINSANTYQAVVEAIAPFDPDADVVTLMLWENLDWVTGRFLEIMVVIDRTGKSQIRPGNRLPKEGFPIAEVMFGERVWIFEDAYTDPRIDEVTAKSWELLDIRSFMGPALYIDQRWAGGITFHSSRPRKYTEREKRLLAGVGDLVIAAIQRIRSQQETREAKEEIDILYRVGEVINGANSYNELVDALSGIISGETAVALYCWENWDFETAAYVGAVAATGYMQPFVGQRTPKAVLSYTQDSQGERVVVVEDTSTYERYDDATKAAYRARGLLAQISIRLYVNQRWIGALVFHSATPRSFSEREQRLAQGVGDYVLGAVERIRAREETEAARQRAEAFAEQAHQLAVLEERNRLARELHDSVSQALYGIVLGAQTARMFLDRDPQQSIEPLDYVLALSEAGLAEMRALIFELRPETLEKEGLIEALSKQVGMLQVRYGLEVRTTFCPEPHIPIRLKEAVYWIAREALHNIVKHAHASTVEIGITGSPDSFMLLIADNGVGFNMDSEFSGHLGLKSMSERALKIGAALQVRSDPGAGTRIELHLPLPN